MIAWVSVQRFLQPNKLNAHILRAQNDVETLLHPVDTGLVILVTVVPIKDHIMMKISALL